MVAPSLGLRLFYAGRRRYVEINLMVYASGDYLN